MIECTKIIKNFHTRCDDCNKVIKKNYKYYISITYNAPYNNALIINKKELDLCDNCYEDFKKLWSQNKLENYIKTEHYGIVDVRYIKTKLRNQSVIVY